MFIYTTGNNILALGLFLLIGTLDLYVFVATLRLSLGRIPAVRAGRLFPLLQELADPLPRYVSQRLAIWRRRPAAAWVPWTIVFIAALVTRQVLLALLMAAR